MVYVKHHEVKSLCSGLRLVCARCLARAPCDPRSPFVQLGIPCGIHLHLEVVLSILRAFMVSKRWISMLRLPYCYSRGFQQGWLVVRGSTRRPLLLIEYIAGISLGVGISVCTVSFRFPGYSHRIGEQSPFPGSIIYLTPWRLLACKGSLRVEPTGLGKCVLRPVRSSSVVRPCGSGTYVQCWRCSYRDEWH